MFSDPDVSQCRLRSPLLQVVSPANRKENTPLQAGSFNVNASCRKTNGYVILMPLTPKQKLQIHLCHRSGPKGRFRQPGTAPFFWVPLQDGDKNRDRLVSNDQGGLHSALVTIPCPSTLNEKSP